MNRFAALNDHDFELFVADLFGMADGRRYEVFARGPDGGVDLRHITPAGPEVIQCKHAVLSTAAQLVADARKERRTVGVMSPEPRTYRFVTSRRLTPANKDAIASAIAPYITTADEVYGEDDLSLLLLKHAAVERRHIKLWMPSSAGLQALLRSAVGFRARTLAEEITRALPLWVATAAFEDGRQMLDEHGVCVIAGAAGIGKTSLAKMLVGDAIDAGAELVVVSGDIEEAWQVHDPGVHQIIYYDDFLGRAALEPRLGRNEEDRLVGFTRLAARSATTRFVLTTREYILQHARQLYERFSDGDLDGRKILLDLPAYTRRQRAQIFYNHAHVSGALTPLARAALLADDAYCAIIDHPKYNPRQIEWITGMSGHTLTSTDNENYVAFAIDALDDQTRLWRHGFERELTDHARALLFTLSGLPDLVSIVDLEMGFGAYCAAARLTVRGRAFDQAMEMLDDSFVRTSVDGCDHFARFYDPSVADFLSSYLADSPEDAIATFNGCAFFEQALRLVRMLHLTDEGSDGVLAAAGCALKRTAESTSPAWHQVRHGRSERVTLERDRVSDARRAAQLGALTTAAPFAGSPDADAAINSAYASTSARAISRWLDGQDEPAAAVDLLREMIDRDDFIDDAAAAAKHLVVEGLVHASAFRAASDLHELVPGIFSDTEWDETRAMLRSVAHDELDQWGEMTDLSEIDEITSVADALDVDIHPDMLEEATKGLAAAIDNAEDQAFEDMRDRRAEQRDAADPVVDDTEVVRAIFTRLAAE